MYLFSAQCEQVYQFLAIALKNNAGAKKVGFGNVSRRAARRLIVRYWHIGTLLVVEQSSSETAPEGCDIHRVIMRQGRGSEATEAVFCL